MRNEGSGFRVQGSGPPPAGQSKIQNPKSKIALLCASVPLWLILAGCVELDLRVKINPDGSAVVTERVRFSEQALDLASTLPAADGLEVFLKKERAEERLRLMGKNVTFVSHEVKDLPGGAKECITVYSAPDVNDLLFCSPAVCYADFEISPMTVAHGPQYTNGSGYNIGMMVIHNITLRRPRNYGRENEGGLKPPPPPISPAELQKYRDLLPVFKDLMKDFRLTCVLECYSPIAGGTRRGTKEMTREYFVIDFRDKNLDQYGTGVLDNEEFMLALIRWDLRNPAITGVCANSESNLTVPVWFPWRGMSMPWEQYIALRPSKPLFDRFFKGKPKAFGGDLDTPASAQKREDLIKWGIIKG